MGSGSLTAFTKRTAHTKWVWVNRPPLRKSKEEEVKAKALIAWASVSFCAKEERVQSRSEACSLLLSRVLLRPPQTKTAKVQETSLHRLQTRTSGMQDV
eukprot:1159821-Pelagomonas_calceolata.AAC.7